MKLTTLFLLLSFSAFGQSTFNDVYQQWTFYPGTADAITFQGQGYQRIVIEPQDSSTYVYTITKTLKVWPPTVVQAYQPATQSGVSIQATYIGSTDTDDYVSYALNLTGRTKIVTEYARQWDNPVQGTAEIRAGSVTGPLLGTILTPNTGSWNTYQMVETAITPSNATTVFIVFKTTGVGNIKTLTFK
jgi:hypothetical protein